MNLAEKAERCLAILPEAVAHRQCKKLGSCQPNEDASFLTYPALEQRFLTATNARFLEVHRGVGQQVVADFTFAAKADFSSAPKLTSSQQQLQHKKTVGTWSGSDDAFRFCSTPFRLKVDVVHGFVQSS